MFGVTILLVRCKRAYGQFTVHALVVQLCVGRLSSTIALACHNVYRIIRKLDTQSFCTVLKQC